MFTHDTQEIATESGYWSICSIKIALCINMCINNGYFLTDLASSSSFRKLGIYFYCNFRTPQEKNPIKIKMCPSVIQKLCLKPNIIMLTKV